MSRANWFADEVAIDFPSVSDLLDSMRHAFFGADALEELSAEVILTPLEAFRARLFRWGFPSARRVFNAVAGARRGRSPASCAAGAAICGRFTTSNCAFPPASAAANAFASR